MHHYEFLCRLCNRPFSKSPTPFESQRRQSGLSTRCGSEEVEPRWFYLVAAKTERVNKLKGPIEPREKEFCTLLVAQRPAAWRCLCRQRDYENSSTVTTLLI